MKINQTLYIDTFNKDNTKFEQAIDIMNYSKSKIKEIKEYKLKTRFLKNGNSKLGKNIYSFDLIAIASCPNYKECFKTCYATKGTFLWGGKGAKTSNTYNFAIALHDLEFLEKELIKDIEKKKIKNIRIHSSGDFYSKEYFEMWVSIAKKYPSLNIFTYSKVNQVLNLELPNNFNIINSFIKIDGTKHLNYGPYEYAKNLAKKSKGLLCPITKGTHFDIPKLKAPNFTCSICKYCITKDKPTFVSH